MINLFQKRIGFVISFSMGVFFTLFLLEVGLRAFGWVKQVHIGPKGEAKHTILCIGNSHTMGIGTKEPEKFSYPAQLERILLKEFNQSQVRVINVGKGNVNTSDILASMEKWLNEYKPDIVTLMVGEPNFWNYYGLRKYIQSKYSYESNLNISFSFLPDLLYHLRVYRWINLVWNDLASSSKITIDHFVSKLTIFNVNVPLNLGLNDEEAKQAYTELSKFWINQPRRIEIGFLVFQLALRLRLYDEAEELALKLFSASNMRFDFFAFKYLGLVLERFTSMPPQKRNALQDLKVKMVTWVPKDYDLKLAEDFFFQLNRDKPRAQLSSCSLLVQFIKSAPLDLYHYQEVVDCLLKEHREEEVVDLLKYGHELNPQHPNSAIRQLAQLRAKIRDPRIIEKINLFIDDYVGKSNSNQFSNGNISDELILDWTEAEIFQIIRRIKTAGIKKIILQSYPPKRDLEYRPIDFRLPSIAQKEGLIYEDLQKLFRETYFLELKNKEKFYTNLYGPYDSHLNEEGYSIVAHDLLILMKKLDYL